MERNIDRNLRMARREVRRFFGGSRRIAGEAVFIFAMIIVSTVYFATERGLIILVGILAVAALIFFILERVFGVYLWRTPRHEFFRINGQVKGRAELAGDIEKTPETLRKMVLDLESLDATASEPLTTRDFALQLISEGSPRRRRGS